MLVVISDLHFEEEESNYIESADGTKIIGFSRNLPAKAFRMFVARLAAAADENGIGYLDLVFAGDIFDLHRTGMWFTEHNPQDLRPYVNNNAVTPQQEEVLLKVLNGIITDEKVCESLGIFKLLSQGRYFKWMVDENSDSEEYTWVEQDFPVKVTFHYIPGNHDRLVNATPALRAKVQEALGMPITGEPFENVLALTEYYTLVRHGHEYDRYNFSADYRHQEIPVKIPVSEYDEAPFGDFVTVDIASRIPRLFRDQHTDEVILNNWMYEAVYLRLLEFDDLRPQTALFNYLINMPNEGITEEDIWALIEPVLKTLLEDVSRSNYLKDWLRRLNTPLRFDIIDLTNILFFLRLWRYIGIPLWLLKWISKRAVGHMDGRPGAQVHAAREKGIKDKIFSFVVAGHTHHPATELLANDDKIERYYIDTGTWRNRVPASPDFSAFGRLKALTYVIIYGSHEDKGTGEARVSNKYASVDFWSGVTQRWEKRSNLD